MTYVEQGVKHGNLSDFQKLSLNLKRTLLLLLSTPFSFFGKILHDSTKPQTVVLGKG